MTDPRHPLTDEDLSAVLDGEAPDGVLGRVQADAGARARLEQLSGARQAVAGASVDPLDPAVVDDLVGRAVRAADELPGHGSGTADVVAPLRPSRRTPRGLPPSLVAAVVVVLAGLGLVLVWSGRDRPTARDQAGVSSPVSASADEGRAAGGAGSSAPGAEKAPGTAADTAATTGASSSADVAGLVPLGAFDTPDQLRTRIKDGLAPEARTADRDPASAAAYQASAAAVDRCDAQVRAVFEIEGAADQRGVATIDGDQILVYRYRYSTEEAPQATTLAVAARSDTCDVVLSFVR